MTREEAIDVLKHNYPSSCYENLCKAVDMAIKALEQPEPCEDTISRQAAIDEFDKGAWGVEWDKVLAKAMIGSLPYAQPEQRWIPCSEETGEGFPKEDGRYYVTEQNYGFYLDADYKEKVAHMSIFKDGDFTTRFYDENHSNITAYFKLPEPYGGEQE